MPRQLIAAGPVAGSSTATPGAVLQLARGRLNGDRLYAHHFRFIEFRFHDGVLTLFGRVPTFHLKAILQSLLRGIEGVNRIDNQVSVVSATGLSSVAL